MHKLAHACRRFNRVPTLNTACKNVPAVIDTEHETEYAFRVTCRLHNLSLHYDEVAPYKPSYGQHRAAIWAQPTRAGRQRPVFSICRRKAVAKRVNLKKRPSNRPAQRGSTTFRAAFYFCGKQASGCQIGAFSKNCSGRKLIVASIAE